MSRHVNLINPAFRKRREWLTATAALWTWGAVAAAMLAWQAGVAHQTRGLSAQSRQVAAALKTQQAKLLEISERLAGQKKDPRLEQELAVLEQRVAARQEVLRFLQAGELGQTQGFSAELAAFARQSTEGLWLTGVTLGGDELTLEGRALAPELIPAYLQRLSREPALRGRAIAGMQVALPKPADEAKAPPQFVEFRVSNRPVESSDVLGGSNADPAGSLLRLAGAPPS